MKHDVQQIVQSCAICQQAKTLHTKPGGILQPLPTSIKWPIINSELVFGDVSQVFHFSQPKNLVQGFKLGRVLVQHVIPHQHWNDTI